jgi:hypothetical protein
VAALVLELQREAMNGKGSVSDLLRMALVVARKLGIAEFEKWIDAELNGYYHRDRTEIPAYRVLQGSVMVENPRGGWQPLLFADARYKEIVSKGQLVQSVGELENSLSTATGHGEFHLEFPPAQESELLARMSGPRMKPALAVTGAMLQGIVDTVRNTALDWSLKLEANGVMGQDMTFSTDERAKASAAQITYHTEIHNMSQSQFQQGTSDSVQIIKPPLDLAAVADLVAKLREHLRLSDLAPEARAQLDAELATVEAQRKSPNPRMSSIRDALHSIRVVLEGAAGAAAGGALLDILKNMLS